MYDISVNDLRESSTGSLELIKRRIDEELTRRKNEERQHLINEFQKAWADLKDAHIRITYYCDEYEDDYTYLDDWDGFSFD